MTRADTQEAGFFTRELLTTIPSLRAFARSLGATSDRADDLVQETLIKAWANQQSFVQGTNLKTWLFTILRNTAYSEYRKRWREVEDADGSYAAGLVTQPAQIAHLDMADFKSALNAVPQEQREALVLIGASGFSYDEAAKICGCAVWRIWVLPMWLWNSAGTLCTSWNVRSAEQRKKFLLRSGALNMNRDGVRAMGRCAW